MSQLLDGGHGELGGHGTVLGPGQGDQVLRRLRADDHAGRMDRAVAGQSLQAPCHIDQPGDPLVALVGGFELRILLQGLIQGHIQFVGHHLGDGIHEAVGQIHDPSHVPDDAPGRQGSEGNDLGDPVLAVFAGHVVDDLLPPFEAEVHVYIGHGDTLRIEEALEEKTVADGIQVRDAQAVGNDGAGSGTSAGPYHDPVLPGVVDIVPDDQEIVHIAHLADGIQLVGQAVL